MVFAGIASFSRTFGNLQAASLNPAEMAGLAGALDHSQLALTVIIAVLFATCLVSHYQIISDLLGDRFSKRFGSAN